MHHTRVNLSVARLHSLDISLESFLLQEISAHDPIGAPPRLALLVPPYPSNAQHRGWMYRNTFWGPRNIHSLVSMYFDFGRRSETPLFEMIHLQVHLRVSRNSSPNESFHACRCRSRCPTRTKDETCTCVHLARAHNCGPRTRTDAHAAPWSDWRII